jgi:peptide/nickel transport system ATP-binding protein
MNARDLAGTRWQEIALVTQSAMNALDPVYRVEDQIVEAIRAHETVTRTDGLDRVRYLFELVGLEPSRSKDYPHQFSGGMLQRAAIAMALALRPKILLADEPTTALDVVMQDGILQRLEELRRETGIALILSTHDIAVVTETCETLGIALILSTHDIAVVTETCETLGVMYAGELTEFGPTREVIGDPAHPYTLGLRQAFPSVRGRQKTLIAIQGHPPDLISPPSGCSFQARCPFSSDDLCSKPAPWIPIHAGGGSLCHRTEDLAEIRRQAAQVRTWGEESGVEVSGAAAIQPGEKTPLVRVENLRKEFPLKQGS